jgi:phospholipase/carboxylesterase
MIPKFQEREVGGIPIVELPADPDKGTILLLHGFGADAFDLLSISHVYKDVRWIFPQGPLKIPFAKGHTGRAWFPVDVELLIHAIREKRFDEISHAFPPELDQAHALIETLLHHLNIPRSKLILGGFSQGAILAIETALKSFERCGGLLIFSGTLINEVSWRALAPLHAKTPFFQSHGTHDPLLPMKKAKDLEQLLIDNGFRGKLHSFHGGHEIPHSILIELSVFLKQLFA